MRSRLKMGTQEIALKFHIAASYGYRTNPFSRQRSNLIGWEFSNVHPGTTTPFYKQTKPSWA